MDFVNLTRDGLDHFRILIEKVSEQTSAKWGTMNPVNMIAHLNLLLDMTLEVGTFPDKSNIFFRTVVKFMVLNVLPMPKGIKAPPAFAPVAKEKFIEERRLLLEKLELFTHALEKTPQRISRHAVFGPLTFTQWGKLHGKHIDHHLRQFAV
jgi:hypothetical protein